MAIQPGPIKFVYSLPASADLSAYQFRFVEVTTGELTLCDAAGDFAVGVLQDKPDAAGKQGEFVYFGPTKMVAGEAISVGDLLTTDDEGRAVVCTPIGAVEANSAILGRAMTAAGTAGDRFGALVNCVNPGPAV
jgi:hypothetical protein